MKSTYAIETKLHIGEYAGLKVKRVANDDISCSEIPRTMIKYFLTNRKMNREKDIQELRKANCSGIYFLVNYKDLKIYIKKTTSVLEDLFAEAFEGDKKTWFNYALFFRKDFPVQFTDEELNYLQWYFIDKVVSSNLNKKNIQIAGNEPNLTEEQYKKMDQYIKSINILLMESPLNLQSSEIAEDSIADEPGFGVFQKTNDFAKSFNSKKEFLEMQKMKKEQKFEEIVSSVMTHGLKKFSQDNSFLDRVNRQNQSSLINHSPINQKTNTMQTRTTADAARNNFLDRLTPNAPKNEYSSPIKNFENSRTINNNSENPFLSNLRKPEQVSQVMPNQSNKFSAFNRDQSSHVNNEAKRAETLRKIDTLFKKETPKPTTDLFKERKTFSFEKPVAKVEEVDGLKPISFDQKHQVVQNQNRSEVIAYKCGKAKGNYVDGFITLLEGSIIKKAQLNPEQQNYRQVSIRIRFEEQQDWLAQGLIRAINNGEEYILLDKIESIQINIATQHVTGEIGIDGKDFWISSNGKTINQIERTV